MNNFENIGIDQKAILDADISKLEKTNPQLAEILKRHVSEEGVEIQATPKRGYDSIPPPQIKVSQSGAKRKGRRDHFILGADY